MDGKHSAVKPPGVSNSPMGELKIEGKASKLPESGSFPVTKPPGEMVHGINASEVRERTMEPTKA